MPQIHKGEKGIEFEVNVGKSLHNLSQGLIVLKSPSGSTSQWTATIKDYRGLLSYILQGNEFDKTGTWKLQSHLTYNNNNVFWGDEAKFTVYPTLIK